MAIDSAEKRQNIAGCGRIFMRSHFPRATPDAEWRIAGGIAYGGNPIASLIAVVDAFRHIHAVLRDVCRPILRDASDGWP